MGSQPAKREGPGRPVLLCVHSLDAHLFTEHSPCPGASARSISLPSFYLSQTLEISLKTRLNIFAAHSTQKSKPPQPFLLPVILGEQEEFKGKNRSEFHYHKKTPRTEYDSQRSLSSDRHILLNNYLFCALS